MVTSMSSVARVRFGAGQASEQARIDGKISRFRQGLEQLVAWDRAKHDEPVLQQVDIATLTRQGTVFLQRQAETGRSVPTPFLIGMAGGTASGKSFAKRIWHQLFPEKARTEAGWHEPHHGPVVSEIELDNYYKDTSERRKQLGDAEYFRKTDLDAPDSLSLDQAARDVMRLKNGGAVRHPRHHFPDSSSIPGATLKAPTPFFFVEGLFTLAKKPLRDLMDMRVFVDAHEEVRTQRWWKRAPERNIRPDEAGHALFNRAMKAHNDHVEPSRAHANVVLNGTARPECLREILDNLTGLLVKTFHP